MDNLFHSHGINLTSLGYIAEKSKSPYVREFCINEMIARTCKKLIFHILAKERMFSFLDLFEKKPSVPQAPHPLNHTYYLINIKNYIINMKIKMKQKKIQLLVGHILNI